MKTKLRTNWKENRRIETIEYLIQRMIEKNHDIIVEKIQKDIEAVLRYGARE